MMSRVKEDRGPETFWNQKLVSLPCSRRYGASARTVAAQGSPRFAYLLVARAEFALQAQQYDRTCVFLEYGPWYRRVKSSA